MANSIRKIFSRDFVLCFFAQLSLITVFYILTPTLPIYLSSQGLRETEIGILVGAFFVSSLLMRPFIGKGLSRFPERNFMLFGASLFTLTTFFYLYAPPFWPLLIVRAFQGIGLSFFHTASYTLIANISPEAHRGESLSYFYLASNLSLALSPSVGIYLAHRFGFTFLFWTCVGISLCCLLISSQIGKKQVTLPEGPAPGKGVYLSREAFPPSLLNFFNYIMWGALTAFFPLYALTQGVSNPGLFFTTIAIMFFLGRFFGGRILDIYSRKKVIPVLIGTCIISMAILTFSKNLPMFILVAILWGIGNGLLAPAILSFALDRAGGSKGPAIGMYTLLSDMGLGLGPVIMGVVIRYSSYPFMFFCLVLTGFINLAYFYIIVRKS